MKRSIILSVYSWFALIGYSAIIVLYFIRTQGIFPVWFSLGCFFLGIYALLKAYFFSHDNMFWLGSSLLLVGFIGIGNFWGILPENFLAVFYVASISFSSLLTAIFYKKHFHYKISFLLILEDFLILLYSNSMLTIWWFVGLSICLAISTLGGKYVFKSNK